MNQLKSFLGVIKDFHKTIIDRNEYGHVEVQYYLYTNDQHKRKITTIFNVHGKFLFQRLGDEGE